MTNKPAPWLAKDLEFVTRRFRAKPTIEELERILEDDEETPIEILPNGEIRALGGSTKDERSGKKPLTMREDLGGEYSQILGIRAPLLRPDAGGLAMYFENIPARGHPVLRRLMDEVQLEKQRVGGYDRIHSRHNRS